MASPKLVGFGNIDRTRDPAYFIRFLDIASAEASFQAYKQRTFELMQVGPGEKVLEVACGTGADAQALAHRLGAGQVIGVDYSQAMIDEARQRAAAAGLAIEFQVSDAQHLAFPDDSFDGCRCDRSFMHIPDAQRALAEMVRVAKPGGRIVVYEVDFGTHTIDAPDRSLARKVMNAWSDSFRNGWLGRYVPGFYADAGLSDIRVEPAVLQLNAALVNEMVGPATVGRLQDTGALSTEEATTWLSYLDAAQQSGRVFSTLTGFIVCGRKPSIGESGSRG